jgi:hypothetical protein
MQTMLIFVIIILSIINGVSDANRIAELTEENEKLRGR